MKTFCKENFYIIFGIIFVAIFQIYYINLATANVPFMDYWRYINEITDKVFTGALTWSDFWITFAGIDIQPFKYLILIANMKFFGLNTRIEIFAGIFVMLMTTLLLYTVYYRIMIKELGYSKYLSQALYFTIVLAIFNFNQWEMLTLEFSFVAMFRIFSFVGIFILLDFFLKDLKGNYKKAVLLGLIIAVVICTLSAGYFPSMVGAVIFSSFLHLILYRKLEGFNYIKKYIVLFGLIGVGATLYLSGVTLSSSGGNIESLIKGVINGNLLKGILIMLSGSIIPTELAAKHGGISFYYIIGIIMFVLYLGATLLYFIKRMWKYNYLPMTLIVYAVANMILIYYARASIFGLEYLSSSRYVCETTLGLIGVLWIFIDTFLGEIKKGVAKELISVASASAIFSILFVLVFLIQSAIIETRLAPYRKIYFEKSIGIMLNLESADDKSLDIFQAGNPKYVRNGVTLMKKYNLGVFHSQSQMNKYSHLIIGTTMDTAQWINGRFDDGWIGTSSELKIRTGPKGKLFIEGYYPNQITGNETGTIYVNEKATNFAITSNNFTIEINTPVSSIVKVKIDNDFSFMANPPDMRTLSFIISDVKVQ